MIFLPKNLPAVEILSSEGLAVAEYALSPSGSLEYIVGSSVSRILFLNIMPQKVVTEIDIARALAHAESDVQLLPMKISGQTYKTTPVAHMDQFYKNFEDYESEYFDGLIITGAPIEHLPFEEVRYWKQLCHIMDWAKGHVKSTLYICWGAQAGLYYHYGIPKYGLNHKLFGIFPQRTLISKLPLLEGLEPEFNMPHSRHTEIRKSDFPLTPDLKILAEGEASGVSLAMSHSGREFFITGHLEYEPNTLHNEYIRDLNKGLPIEKPLNYYWEDQPEKGVHYSWEGAAWMFYRNWVKYYCKAINA